MCLRRGPALRGGPGEPAGCKPLGCPAGARSRDVWDHRMAGRRPAGERQGHWTSHPTPGARFLGCEGRSSPTRPASSSHRPKLWDLRLLLRGPGPSRLSQAPLLLCKPPPRVPLPVTLTDCPGHRPPERADPARPRVQNFPEPRLLPDLASSRLAASASGLF